MPKRNKMITDNFTVIKKSRAKVQNPPNYGDIKRSLRSYTHSVSVKPPVKTVLANEDDVSRLTDEKEILRQFDLNYEYGPCVGLKRLERWERASMFGLNPPLQVKEFLARNNGTEDYEKCIWASINI